MGCEFRSMTASDLPFALDQTRREGWNAAPAWFAMLMEHDPALCLVAEDGARPVAMITATRFARSAWIGNLIVMPDHRRSGLGTRLMEKVMGELTAGGVRTIRLEADPPGVNIYRRLGFREEFESLRFHGLGSIGPLPSCAIAADEESTAELVRFDRERFGDDRSRLLGLAGRRAEATFVGLDTDGMRAYAMAVGTDGGLHVGPWVAGDPDTAADVLAPCLALADGRDLRVGVPAPNAAGAELLRSLGFAPTPPSLRMVWGEHLAGGRPEEVYGILNGAVG